MKCSIKVHSPAGLRGVDLLDTPIWNKGTAFDEAERYQNELLTFNDDVQGTAAVVLGAVTGASKVAGKSMREHKLVASYPRNRDRAAQVNVGRQAATAPRYLEELAEARAWPKKRRWP
jgi:hypothetical protein